jgi:hypothetical protein
VKTQPIYKDWGPQKGRRVLWHVEMQHLMLSIPKWMVVGLTAVTTPSFLHSQMDGGGIDASNNTKLSAAFVIM